MTTPAEAPRPSRRVDPVVALAVVVAIVLRVAPLWLWGISEDDCTRDECIYKIVSRPIIAGEGLGLAPAGWVPAPGYPYLLALVHAVTGRIEWVKAVHVALGAVSTGLMAWLGRHVADRRTGRVAAWGYALHPTLIFYAGTLWIETVYSTLLLALLAALVQVRDRSWWTAAIPGLLLGTSVLFRGVATFLAPILVLALVLPDAGQSWRAALSSRWKHAAALVAAMVLLVAPYSVHASRRWGGPMISDATFGHVIHLGNDDFPPVTFDYGNGQLTGQMYTRTLKSGRPDCPARLSPVEHDRCEVTNAVDWIRANPDEFVRRVPMRLAQLLNPHSFLTRHVRWGLWPGLPWGVREGLVTLNALTTIGIVLLGTVGAFVRSRGTFGLAAVGTTLYHIGVIAALYGLTRFRLPVEPIWLIFAAAVIAHPTDAWRRLRAAPLRLAGTALSVAVLAWLMSWYLPTGYPGFW